MALTLLFACFLIKHDHCRNPGAILCNFVCGFGGSWRRCLRDANHPYPPLLTLYLSDAPEGWLYRIAQQRARIRARAGNSPRIEKEKMMARREGTISAKPPEESSEPAPSQAKRPDIGQFRLQV